MTNEKNYEEFAALGWEGFRTKKDVLEEYRAFRILNQEEDAVVEEIRDIFDLNPDEIGVQLKAFFGHYDILDVSFMRFSVAEFSNVQVMHYLCSKLKEMTMEITSNYPYKFWELKLELDALQSVCDKLTDEKYELQDKLKYAVIYLIANVEVILFFIGCAGTVNRSPTEAKKL